MKTFQQRPRRFKWWIAIQTILFAAAQCSVIAFDYRPTPIAKMLAEHDLVLVAEIAESGSDAVKAAPRLMIKGKKPEGMIHLPLTWGPQDGFSFPGVRFKVGKMYLLLLNDTGTRGYTLSSDFAALEGVCLESANAPLVRAAIIVNSLSQHDKIDSRKEVLARSWKEESNATKKKLLEEFWVSPRDVATVPFLLEAMKMSPEDYGLVERAAEVILKHQYQETAPAMLMILQERQSTSLFAARILAKLKDRSAYDPIKAIIKDPVHGNRPYFIEALAELEDPRAIPFLMELLLRNLPGLDPAAGTYTSWSLQENEFAAEGLGRLRASVAVQPLVKLLALEAEPYRKLRTNSVEALGKIGPPASDSAKVIRRLMEAELISTEVGKQALRTIEK